MNVPLLVAGLFAVLAAAVHGGAGELLVVRKLSPQALPPTKFGGPRTTRAMIHVSWHLATVGFLTVGCALIVAAVALHGAGARALALLSAGAATGFAGLVVGLGAAGTRSLRGLWRHPGPVIVSAIAVLAWVGAL